MDTISKKVFLLLQGPPGWFASCLASALERKGYQCLRINLCVGDWIFWRGKQAVNYRGSLEQWPQFLSQFIVQHQVTDIVYYADRLPYHALAKQVADEHSINAITYEHGYLRPNWLTVERGGMSRFSHFPDCQQHIKRCGKDYPVPIAKQALSHPFWKEALFEVVFNLTNYFDVFFFPKYNQDKVYNPLIEYLNYIPRLLSGQKAAKRAEQVVSELYKDKKDFFVFPLQMQNDYQLRDNSPFNHQSEAINLAISAFSQHASKDSILLFKVHPLDNGIEPWHKIIQRLARQHHVTDRVVLVDGGYLNEMLANCCGVLTVNSTVGVQALALMKPVKVLGYSVYDIDGLTCQQKLSDFFRNPIPPESELVDCFLRLLGGTIQVHGNFYSENGLELGAEEISDWLINDFVQRSDLFFDVPPRLLKEKEYA